MPMFDIVCWECMVILKDKMLKYKEQPTEKCPTCGGDMMKKVEFGSFELKYNNKKDMCDWTGETSQYWTAFKDAKARGENVKPADEE